MKKIMAVIVILLVSTAAVLAAAFTASAGERLADLGTDGLSITESAVEGKDYTYTDNVLTVISSNSITISGTTTDDRIVVDSPNGANITLKDINVDSYEAAFEIAETTLEKVTVTLEGSNKLVSGGDFAGLQKNGDSCELLINGSGSLDVAAGVRGGAGIGGENGRESGNITIADGILVIANSQDGAGAGIGGGNGGSGSRITISGGTVNVVSEGAGAAIGGGNEGEGKNITITGGTIVAAVSDTGAGIGGGENAGGDGITISGGVITDVYSTGGGACIGGGSGGDGSNITIENVKLDVTAKHDSDYGYRAAAIGGGDGGNGSGITIKGTADVTAVGSDDAAAIGGGKGGDGANITIEGSAKVKAEGGIYGAGIGGGDGGLGTHITIKDKANVTAISQNDSNLFGGAGIGGGSEGSARYITICGEAVVIAESQNGAGIGGGAGGGANGIEIYGSADVTASGIEGAGIGGGTVIGNKGGSAENISIYGSAKVKAVGEGGAAIGSGSPSNQGEVGTVNNIKISENAHVEAIGSRYAGIGSCGENGEDEGVIEISGGTVTAIGEVVGIGSSSDSDVNIMISGGEVTASGFAAGIGSANNRGKIKVTGGTVKAEAADNSGMLADIIEINGGNVTAIGDKSGISGKFVTIDGANTNVTATGVNKGFGITGAEDESSEIRIFNGTVIANGGSCGIGGADEPATISITGGVTAATGYIGIGGTDDTVYIRGTDSTHYPWVFTNEIESANYDSRFNDINGYWGIVFEDEDGTAFTDRENNNFNEGIVYGTNKTVELTGNYTLTTGKTLTVPENVTFAANNMLTLNGASVYYVYGEHRFNFDDPEKIDGKLHYNCADCDYVLSMDIPVVYVIKTDGATGEPLVGAEFGIYGNEACTSQISTAASAMDAGNNRAGISFEALPNRTYYIKETKAPNGYRLSQNVYRAAVGADGRVTYSVVGTAGTSNNIPVCENIAETPVVPVTASPAKLIKADGDGNALVGAEFGLYSDQACTVLITNAVTAIDTNRASNTYNKAIVSFDTELNTTYYIKEISAPRGYRLSQNVYRAAVGADGKVTYSVVGTAGTSNNVPECVNAAETTIVPEPVTASPAKLVKVDGSGNALVGAEFGLYSDQACTVLITNAVTAIDADRASDTYNSAIVSFNTALNTTYYIKEISAPRGYRLSQNVYRAAVGADGRVTYSVVGTAGTSDNVPECVNIRENTGDISTGGEDRVKIIKVDGEGNALVGAEFGLYSDEACTALIARATAAIDTDRASDTYNSAIVSFNTALNTTYYIKEISAPNGFTASDMVFAAVVGADGNITYSVVGLEGTTNDVPICVNIRRSDDTSTPSGDTSTPSGDTSTPSGDTSTPSGDTSTPSGDTSTPSGDTSTPSGDTSTPSGDTSTPSGDTSTPSDDTSTPSDDTSTPSGNTGTSGGNTSNAVHDPDYNPPTGISVDPAVFAAIAGLGYVILAASKKMRGK